ncbi:MAG: L,D-transpeptidase [Chloroflexota bacterium]|nr:L,D-transpeptidase [Chloroflexota bacterium]
MIKSFSFIVLIVVLLSFSTAAQVAAVDELGVPDQAILDYPAPQVEALLPNEALLYDRRYERVVESVTLFNAPNGSPTRILDKGFNYLTTGAKQDGWTQVNGEEWVPDEHLRAAQPSRFAGMLLPEAGLPYPVGWILINVVPSRAPGTEPTDGDLATLRYTRVNLYSQTEIDGWVWFQIGIDQWVEQRLIARVLPVTRTADIDTAKWVSVDLYEQVAIAYEGDRPVFATLIASGLNEWPTNEGLFHVYVRFPRTIMSGADGLPDFYYLEEVPWTMYFDGDIGLHGTYWHDGFGYRHSHGCVNLSITDSAWLYNWSSSEIDTTVPGDTGAAIYVYSSGVYR